MYTSSAPYYDKLYNFKDYEAEAKALVTAVSNLVPDKPAIKLLDVGCGTAEHHRFLPDSFQVEGFDIAPEFVNIAAKKNPNGAYFVADMHEFATGREYDVITCMFSSIAYMQTLERVEHALNTMANHLAPGGVLIVEPWFTPEGYTAGFVSQLNVDEPELQICRMTYTEREGDVSVLNFHYVAAKKGEGMVSFDEQHRLGLFTKEQMLSAMAQTGLEARFDDKSGIPRDLYIGRK